MSEATLDHSVSIHRSTVRLVQADITEMDTDAFLFYAQSDLALGSGYGGAIAVRGGPSIQKELDTLGPVEVGGVVVTEAGKLKASFILHAVGPRFNEPDTEAKLRDTVARALEVADKKGMKRVAFPPMGTGFYGIPLPLCARVMLEAIGAYLEGETGIEEVVLCAKDRREFLPFQAELATMGRSEG